VCLFVGTSAAQSLELLAKNVDMLLRKNNKVTGDIDLEKALNWVVQLRQKNLSKSCLGAFLDQITSNKILPSNSSVFLSFHIVFPIFHLCP
jgi:hypothetical protein